MVFRLSLTLKSSENFSQHRTLFFIIRFKIYFLDLQHTEGQLQMEEFPVSIYSVHQWWFMKWDL